MSVGGSVANEDLLPGERTLHALLMADPRASADAAMLQRVEDADARENWTEFLRFRDRVLAFRTLDACYRDLFHRPAVDLAPPFVDALAEVIVRDLLEGTDDPFLCRAAGQRARVSHSHDPRSRRIHCYCS